MIEAHLKSLGMWYGRGEHRPVSRTVLNAIDAMAPILFSDVELQEKPDR